MPGPTVGVPQNTTATTVAKRVPTATFVYNATAETHLARVYKEHCPVTEEDLERGFEWYYLSRECDELLRPYCNPLTDTPEPTEAASIPSNCLPDSVMGWQVT